MSGAPADRANAAGAVGVNPAQAARVRALARQGHRPGAIARSLGLPGLSVREIISMGASGEAEHGETV